MIFQGIRTSVANIPYIFVIFRWGPDPTSGSAHKFQFERRYAYSAVVRSNMAYHFFTLYILIEKM